MEFDFKTLTMMKLRSSPGEILDRVHEGGEAFIIERNGRQKACLVPVWYFLPDIPKNKVNEELNELHKNGENPILTVSDKKEVEMLFKETVERDELTLKIILPHGYPNVAPKTYVSPIITDTPHRWQDGALCIFGAMTNWNPGKHNVAFVLTLARKWLASYSEWRKKGVWPNQVESNK
ncbi:MAG: type II toxin-antitoxin system Phd/YefM family antitoxin [Planctomycetes bacterium]|nr:type II toxin-antitoxin system Phd/YefM family antitoxin [Planctomycetota bacterium]